MNGLEAAKELYMTEDVFEVLAYLKKEWLLYQVASHGDIFKFLLIRV